MTEIIQIGVLGCGEMGRTLSQAVAATGLGRIRSVFDTHPEKSSALARVHQAEAAASEDILLANKDLQAVIVALPPFAHCESVLKIAQAGKHVFLEKPMALNLADCHRMNLAIHKAGVTLMVGHVLRYFEPFQTITRWARERKFGNALHGAFWRLERDYIRLATWKGKRAMSGGYLFEVGAHELDWMRRLFGEPTEVQATVQKKWPSEHEIEDLVSLQIQFGRGIAGTYLGGAGFPYNEHGFTLHFETATIQSDNAFDPQAVKIEHLDPAGPGAEQIFFSLEEPYQAQIRDWLGCLIEGREMPITGEDAARTVGLIESAYQSAGQEVFTHDEK